VKRVSRAAFPQAQQGNADLFETVAQSRLGHACAGRAWVAHRRIRFDANEPVNGLHETSLFFWHRKKPEALKLIRSAFSDRLTSERNEGEVTFLKISLGGKQTGTGVAQWNFFNLAVTQDMILGANRIETLREVLSSRAHASASGLAPCRQFQARRANSPKISMVLVISTFKKSIGKR